MARFWEHERGTRDGSSLSSLPLNSRGLWGDVLGVRKLLFGRHLNLTVTQSSCNPTESREMVGSINEGSIQFGL